MNSMRALATAAFTAGATVDAVYAQYEAAFAPVMVPRDNDCAELPKLCTDGVMLSGGLTTLTYLCPDKTKVPSTVTVTTTATTTVTVDLPDSTIGPAPSSVFDIAPTSLNEGVSISTSEEPTTTMTIFSTANVTRVVTVTKAADSPSLTPAPITDSFTAILPSNAGSSLTPALISDSFTAVLPSILHFDPVASVAASSVSSSMDYSVVFPMHTVITNSSSAAYSPPPVTSSSCVASSFLANSSSSTSSLSSAAYSALLYSNSTSSTSSHSRFHAPTFIVDREAKSTETVASTKTLESTEVVTSTATGPASTSSKGMAGESQVSFVALFLGLMVAAQIV